MKGKMYKYYFTYGSDPEVNNHVGGWTEVIAKSANDALKAYDAVYGNCNYCMMYCEPHFNQTDMPSKGNKGVFKHNEIVAEELNGVK